MTIVSTSVSYDLDRLSYISICIWTAFTMLLDTETLKRSSEMHPQIMEVSRCFRKHMDEC